MKETIKFIIDRDFPDPDIGWVARYYESSTIGPFEEIRPYDDCVLGLRNGKIYTIAEREPETGDWYIEPEFHKTHKSLGYFDCTNDDMDFMGFEIEMAK